MGREGGGERVMIEIIISENDDNDGRPLNAQKAQQIRGTTPLLVYM